MSVDVVIEAGGWPEGAPLWAEMALDAIAGLLDREVGEVAILLTGDAQMQKLNAEFRGKDAPTNVLSWPSVEYVREPGERPLAVSDDEGFWGDLAFGYQRCVSEAAEIGIENHFKHLVIHGVLHLLGYDHEDEKDAEMMEALEIEALSRLNIASPYEGEE